VQVIGNVLDIAPTAIIQKGKGLVDSGSIMIAAVLSSFAYPLEQGASFVFLTTNEAAIM